MRRKSWICRISESVLTLQRTYLSDLSSLAASFEVKTVDSLLGFSEIDVSVHVHCDSLADVVLGSDAIDALLHLAMATVATL